MKISGPTTPGSPTDGRRHTRPLAVALASILVLTLAAGCGSSTNPQGSADKGGSGGERSTSAREASPLETVQVAYRNTTERDTARFAMTMDISGITPAPAQPGQSPGAEPAEMRMTSRGVVDFESGALDLTMRMPYLGEIHSRQVGDTLYQKYPPEMQAQLTGGKPWAKIDLDALSQQYGMSAAEMGGGAQSDPTQQLAYLRSVSDSVEKIGEEEVRGVATTHYRATVDLDETTDGEPQTEQARQAYDELVEQLGTDRLPVEVWLDGEGQVRRYEMSMPLVLPEGSSTSETGETGGRIRIVQELYDFGTPVNVEAPPAARTTDLTEMVAEQNSNGA